MSSLPPNYTDGNILFASELNTMLAARDGDLTPIDPVTKVEIDDTYSLGAPTKRFKDGHLSGVLRVAGQNYMRARPNVQNITGGTNDNIGFVAAFDSRGVAITQVPSATPPNPPFGLFLLNESGTYVVIVRIRHGGTNTIGIIRQYRPIAVFLEQLESGSKQSGGFNITAIVDAQVGDTIEIRAIPDVTTAIATTVSECFIMKLF